MNKLLTTSLIAGALVGGNVQAAGDLAAGQTKSATCIACHMADGNSVNPIWPKIAGQHPRYVKKQLMDFKSGNRVDPLMSAQAAPLSDQDVEDLAAYFYSQKQNGGSASPDQVAKGERFYRGGNIATGVAACAGCHGPTGSGNPASNFPAIAGQHADYTAKTIKDFRAGKRANDPGQMMRNIASRMTDAEIEAVAQYIQGLQ